MLSVSTRVVYFESFYQMGAAVLIRRQIQRYHWEVRLRLGLLEISHILIIVSGDNSLSKTQAPSGVIIDARYTKNELFYFEPKEPGSSEISIKAIFPRRGGEAGGNPLHMYGVNFPPRLRPSVSVGSKLCRNPVRISSTEIKCIIPGWGTTWLDSRPVGVIWRG